MIKAGRVFQEGGNSMGKGPGVWRGEQNNAINVCFSCKISKYRHPRYRREQFALTSFACTNNAQFSINPKFHQEENSVI